MYCKENHELFRIFHRLHKLKVMNANVVLSKSEFIILDSIMRMKLEGDEEPKVTISNIAKRLSATKPATSKMVTTMEEKGYINRRNDKEDKRLTYVVITPKGECELEKAYKSFQEFQKKIIEKMGDKDLTELTKLLKKLVEIIEEEVKERKERN